MGRKDIPKTKKRAAYLPFFFLPALLIPLLPGNVPVCGGRCGCEVALVVVRCWGWCEVVDDAVMWWIRINKKKTALKKTYLWPKQRVLDASFGLFGGFSSCPFVDISGE
jgi:hypothetical protein